MNDLPNVGFVGLGAMGEPMVRSLRRGNFSVSACAHRNRAPLERLTQIGVVACDDSAAVASRSDVVILCVPDAPEVEEVLFGARSVSVGARAGSIVVDMSTISPIASKRFAARLNAVQIAFVDAPVSGGPVRAESGTLTIMVGADAQDYARVQLLLSAMGTSHHLGSVGMGETVKLVNQIIIASVMIANAEALSFAQRAGADVDAVRRVIATATGSNYVLDQWLPKTWFSEKSEKFAGGFALDLLRKDLAAALDTARAMGFAMPTTGLAYQLYTACSEAGDGALDYSAIAKAYERRVEN